MLREEIRDPTRRNPTQRFHLTAKLVGAKSLCIQKWRTLIGTYASTGTFRSPSRMEQGLLTLIDQIILLSCILLLSIFSYLHICMFSIFLFHISIDNIRSSVSRADIIKIEGCFQS